MGPPLKPVNDFLFNLWNWEVGLERGHSSHLPWFFKFSPKGFKARVQAMQISAETTLVCIKQTWLCLWEEPYGCCKKNSHHPYMLWAFSLAKEIWYISKMLEKSGSQREEEKQNQEQCTTACHGGFSRHWYIPNNRQEYAFPLKQQSRVW